MRKYWELNFFVIVTLILVIFSQGLFAGITGKISGLIKDAETGEPLPGVNIVIEGTTLGAASNLASN